MKKIFAIFIAVGFILSAKAQISKVIIQASGLTCSMCSNSISKALKTLPYAESVTSDIQNSAFEIKIRPGSKVNFDEIRKKVEGAGFSVASLKASMRFSNQQIGRDDHVKTAGMTLHFLNVPEKKLEGEQLVQVLDKGFVSAKTFSKNAAFTKMDCYRTGVAAACCSSHGITAGTRIYHVAI